MSFTTDTLHSIQRLYKSDIRSMINHMQSNQNLIDKSFVINNSIWDTLIHHITTLSNSEIITEIDNISKLICSDIINLDNSKALYTIFTNKKQ